MAFGRAEGIPSEGQSVSTDLEAGVSGACAVDGVWRGTTQAWEQWRGQGRWVEGLEARQGSALVPWAPRSHCWLPSSSEGPGL